MYNILYNKFYQNCNGYILINELKKYFPIFQKNPKIVYLDSGASAQKLQSVIDAMDDFYTQTYANIHRGLYKWSEVSSEMYDAVREKVAKFIGAKSPSEIVFTHGCDKPFGGFVFKAFDGGR